MVYAGNNPEEEDNSEDGSESGFTGLETMDNSVVRTSLFNWSAPNDIAKLNRGARRSAIVPDLTSATPTSMHISTSSALPSAWLAATSSVLLLAWLRDLRSLSSDRCASDQAAMWTWGG